MRKRGQVTIFIILGLIIVASVIIIVWLRPGGMGTKQAEALAVPEKAQAVQRHFQICVEDLVQQGVNLLGIQGGYINLPQNKVVNPYYPFLSSLEIMPGSGMEVAYWYYLAPNNVRKLNIPSIEDMENELSDYIESNIGKCMDDIELLDNYNVTASDAVSADVKINDEDVNVKLSLSIKIYLKDFQYEITQIYVEQKTELGEMYQLAKEITEDMLKNNFIEERTIDILATDQDIPYSGTEFSCKPKVWTVDKVKQKLKQALAFNLPLIKIKGTKFETKNKYYLWSGLKKRYKDLSVSLRYSTVWPLKLEVEPSENGILKALPLNSINNEALAYLTSLFCITDYNFIYDIIYPVLITINDGSGNIFQVANFVVIDNNQPKQNKEGMVEFETQHKEICDNAVNPITVYVLAPDNNGNLNAVPGADVKLKCITTTCALGKTSSKPGTEPKLKTRAPQCVNAQLLASKDNYHPGSVTVDTINSDTYSVVIEPYKTLRYEIKVIENGYERELTEDDSIIFSINNEDKKFSTTLTEPSGKIQLIPANFELRSVLVSKTDGYKIEGKEVEHCYKVPKQNLLGLLGFTEQKCISTKMDDIELDQAITGGSLQYWTLTRDKLNNANKVTFYVPAYALPETVDEMQEVYEKTEDLNNAIQPMLE